MTFPEYHKINGLYKRTERGELMHGEFSRPEYEYLYYDEWICTEKVDGTNIRIGWDPETQKTRIGGRTDNAQIPGFLLEALDSVAGALNAAVLQGLGEFDPACAYTIYGEGYGARIQKGGGNYLSDGCHFALFDVRAGDWWLTRDDVVDVASLLDVTVVPIVASCTLEDAERFVQVGFNSAWGDFGAEGVVCTPAVPLFARDGHRVITKIKTKDYTRIALAEVEIGGERMTQAQFDAARFPLLLADAPGEVENLKETA